MAQQLSTLSGPEKGFSVARQVMEDTAMHYLNNGSVEIARYQLTILNNVIRELYPDAAEAFQEVMALINEAEERQKRAEEDRLLKRLTVSVLSALTSFNAQEVQNIQNQARIGTGQVPPLPPELATERAMKMWERARSKGYVDDHYQPLIPRKEAAILASMMARRLGIWKKWQLFEPLWHRSNMKADLSHGNELPKNTPFIGELNALFADI